MSTEATTTTVAPGTPGSEPTPLAPTAKSMISDVFKKNASPAEPAKAPEQPKAVEPAKVAEAPKPEAAKKEVAPAKEPPKAPEPELPEDKLQFPANAAPETVKNFSAYKDSMKKILADERAAKAALEKQLATYKTATPADTAETERLRSEHQKAMDRLAVLDLQNHPDFVKQYVQPKEKALAAAKEVLDYNEKQATDLPVLLSKSLKEFNAAISEMTKDMNSADAATVATAMREARNLHASSNEALSSSSKLREQFQQKSAQEAKKAFEAVASELVPAFAKRELSDTMTPEERQVAEAYNLAVEKVRTNAEQKAFGKIGEREVAAMAFKEAGFDLFQEHVIPDLERRFTAQNQIIKDLTAQLEAVKGARAPGTLAGDAGAKPVPKSTKEMIASVFAGRR